MPIDYEYIRLLMLYSDEKFPFEKAKSDPGLSESEGSVNRYMDKYDSNRKFDNGEAQRILMHEKHAREQFMLNKARGQRGGRDRDDGQNNYIDFTPKAENQLNEIENKMNTQSNLENEVAMLRKALQDKEAELQARKVNEQPKDEGVKIWGIQTHTPLHNPQPPVQPKQNIPDDGRIIERKLEDTGYSDKINK
jgi:hypothetical protein